MKELNIRLIIIHLLATTLLISGSKGISEIRDIDLLIALRKIEFKNTPRDNSSENMQLLVDQLDEKSKLNFGQRLHNLTLRSAIYPIAAYLISVFISFYVGFKNRIHWFSSFIVLILGFFAVPIIREFDIYNKSLGLIMNILSVQFSTYVIIIYGAIKLLLGIFLFFSNWSMNLIQNKSVNR
jgi:hypothetical protein